MKLFSIVIKFANRTLVSKLWLPTGAKFKDSSITNSVSTTTTLPYAHSPPLQNLQEPIKAQVLFNLRSEVVQHKDNKLLDTLYYTVRVLISKPLINFQTGQGNSPIKDLTETQPSKLSVLPPLAL